MAVCQGLTLLARLGPGTWLWPPQRQRTGRASSWLLTLPAGGQLLRCYQEDASPLADTPVRHR